MIALHTAVILIKLKEKAKSRLRKFQKIDNWFKGGAEQYDVLWLHNEKEIKPSKDFEYKSSGQTHSLVIQEIFPEDAGSYTCEAFNDVGECFSTCSLVVEVPGEEVRRHVSDFNKSVYFTNLKCMNPYLTAAHIVISTIMISVPTWERISLSNKVESFATCSPRCTMYTMCSPRCTRPSSPPSPPR